MNDLKIFENDMFGQLTIINSDTHGILFLGYEVAEMAGYLNPRDVISRLDPDYKLKLNYEEANELFLASEILDAEINSNGITLINESGLYKLALGKNKAFEKWVTKDVLPSIRSTGKYTQKSVGSEAKKLLNSVIIEYAADKLDTRQLIYILSFLFSKEGHGSISKIYAEIDEKIYEKTMFDMDCITERRNCKRRDVFNRKKDLANTGLMSLIELYEPGLLDQVSDLIMDPCQKSLVAFKEGGH